MRKLLAYAAWFIISLVTLVILRNIARHEFPEHSAVIMGLAFAAVIYAFYGIKSRLSKAEGKQDVERS